MLKKLLTYFEMLIIPHALHCVDSCIFVFYLIRQSGMMFWFQLHRPFSPSPTIPPPPPPPPKKKKKTFFYAPEGTLGGILKSHRPSIRNKLCVSHYSKADKRNLNKLYRTVKQKKGVSRTKYRFPRSRSGS